MRISATVVNPIFIELECDDSTPHQRIKELIMQQALSTNPCGDLQIVSCLKINVLCPEENEEISNALG
jgi:hypothetical protein